MSADSPLLLRLANAIDALNSWVGRSVSWLTVFLVLGTALVVLLRYGFGIGATALQEAVLYAHGLVFMGAAAWVLQRNGHVRVDILYQKFSGRRQILVELFGTLFLLLPVCLFISWASWDYVSNAWSTFEGSSETGGLKYIYLQKSIILIMSVGLTLQGLANIIKSIYRLSGRLPLLEMEVTAHG